MKKSTAGVTHIVLLYADGWNGVSCWYASNDYFVSTTGYLLAGKKEKRCALRMLGSRSLFIETTFWSHIASRLTTISPRIGQFTSFATERQ